MFVIAQYMFSASTVFPRHPAKAVVCLLFQLLYLPGIQPCQMSSNSFFPSHNSLCLPGIRPWQMSSNSPFPSHNSLYLPGIQPWQLSSNSPLPSHNSLYLPVIQPWQMSSNSFCLLITPSTSQSIPPSAHSVCVRYLMR